MQALYQASLTPDEDGERPSKRSKTRTTYSCRHCRRNKIKCDRATKSPCTSCQMRDIECIAQDNESNLPPPPTPASASRTNGTSNGREDTIISMLTEIKAMLQGQTPAALQAPANAPEPAAKQDLYSNEVIDLAQSLLHHDKADPQASAGPSTMLLTRAFSILPAFPVVEGLISAWGSQCHTFQLVDLPRFFQRWEHLKQLLAIAAEPFCSLQEALTLATTFDLLAKALTRLPAQHITILTLSQFMNAPLDLHAQAQLYTETSNWICNKLSEEASRTSKGLFLGLGSSFPSLELIELFNLKQEAISDSRQFDTSMIELGAHSIWACQQLGLAKISPTDPNYEWASSIYWVVFMFDKYKCLKPDAPAPSLRAANHTHPIPQLNTSMSRERLFQALTHRYALLFGDWVELAGGKTINCTAVQRLLSDLDQWRTLCGKHGFQDAPDVLVHALFNSQVPEAQYRARQSLIMHQRYFHMLLKVYRYKALEPRAEAKTDCLDPAIGTLSILHCVLTVWQRTPHKAHFNLAATLDWLPHVSFDACLMLLGMCLENPSPTFAQKHKPMLYTARSDWLIMTQYAVPAAERALNALDQLLPLLDQPAVGAAAKKLRAKEILASEGRTNPPAAAFGPPQLASADSGIFEVGPPTGLEQAGPLPFLLDLSLQDLMALEASMQM